MGRNMACHGVLQATLWNFEISVVLGTKLS